MKKNTNKKLKSDFCKNHNKKLLTKIKNWQKDNQKAIDSYNQRIKENGLFSDGLRLF